MNRLDAYTLPFDNNALIEASAGTGKTYTIANLYLRLVVGHQCQPLSAESILILTFTNAATAELKERILARINEAHRAFCIGSSSDDFIDALIKAVPNKEAAQKRLYLASQEMDLAAIFTIHGFCQKMLSEYAFESNSEYEQEFQLDDEDYLFTAAKDFWRKFVVNLSQFELSVFLKHWPEPEILALAVRPLFMRELSIEPLEELARQKQISWQRYSDILQRFKTWWIREAVSEILLTAKLRKNSVLAKPDFHQQLTAFCQSDEMFFSVGKHSWDTFAPEKIAKAKTKQSPEVNLNEFVIFEHLASDEASLLAKTRRYFLFSAFTAIKRHMQLAKSNNNLLTPDDLLVNLRTALSRQQDNRLVNALSNKYPVALVDEFQDTDKIQFEIFERLYPFVKPTDLASNCLVMIGDPKQAIYGFRGGDIFTYISAKRKLSSEQHYTLADNWRSQPDLVSVTNRLFTTHQNAFMHAEDIPFQPVNARKKQITITVGQNVIAPAQFAFLNTEKPLNWTRAADVMASRCAQQIQCLLLEASKDGCEIESSDICILVRDRFEAELIKAALNELAIDSVYLAKETVFESSAAYSLLLCLEAIYHFKEERKIKAALLDKLFQMRESDVAEMMANLVKWHHTLSLFKQANHVWSEIGIDAAINVVFEGFGIYQKLAKHSANSHRIITDIRHLTELLQSQAQTQSGCLRLLQWYKEKLANPDTQPDIKRRLETDDALVQIVTMHASKGLQYPFVFIPFASRYKSGSGGFYHDGDNNIQMAFDDNDELNEQIDKERLAEDIRLFYVAFTRAEAYCYVGLWNNSHHQKRSSSGFHLTALGYLLAPKLGHFESSQAIVTRLEHAFGGCAVSIIAFDESNNLQIEASVVKKERSALPIKLNQLVSPLRQNWFITSYSAISKMLLVSESSALPESDHFADPRATNEARVDTGDVSISSIEKEAQTSTVDVLNQNDNQLATRFSFTKGANAGSFLHEVLEFSDFQLPDSLADKASEIAIKYGFTEEDIVGVPEWLCEVISTPFGNTKEFDVQSFSLSTLTSDHMLPEMEFYLPLERVGEQAFNQLLQEFYPDLLHYYQIKQLNGVLKGFIDLTYWHNNRFYVADYKSNHLGDDWNDYCSQKLEHAMKEHDYILQAIFYCLALHKHLKSKLSNYDYNTHIGGAYYLFLRGMSTQHKDNGIYFFKPEKALITRLEALFSANTGLEVES